MKLISVFIVAALAAVAGIFVLKRMGHGGELPGEGFDAAMPLTPVPPVQEAP